MPSKERNELKTKVLYSWLGLSPNCFMSSFTACVFSSYCISWIITFHYNNNNKHFWPIKHYGCLFLCLKIDFWDKSVNPRREHLGTPGIKEWHHDPVLILNSSGNTERCWKTNEGQHHDATNPTEWLQPLNRIQLRSLDIQTPAHTINQSQ